MFIRFIVILWISFEIFAYSKTATFVSPIGSSNRMIMSRKSVSRRIEKTDRPFIEDVLDKYLVLPNITSLALGSSIWIPPEDALERLADNIRDIESSRYGSIMGIQPLRDRIIAKLTSLGLNMVDQDIMVTCGANQAFMNVALALCDDGDEAIVVAPYYFCHKSALQMTGANVTVFPFEPSTLLPDIEMLKSKILELKPVMIVITTPNNPSGIVWSRSHLEEVANACRETNTWLVMDETYYEFLYDGAMHSFLCAKQIGYERIVHISSFSKAFGMAGWRVGYLAYPSILTASLRKIQDTIPCHTSILSQKLAVLAMDEDEKHLIEHGRSWVQDRVMSLIPLRESLWTILSKLGTVRSSGAFYFLVPVPAEVDEEEAVDVLARQYGVLLMPGYPFGAPGYMRISYGNVPNTDAIARLDQGIEHLLSLSKHRSESKL